MPVTDIIAGRRYGYSPLPSTAKRPASFPTSGQDYFVAMLVEAPSPYKFGPRATTGRFNEMRSRRSDAEEIKDGHLNSFVIS